MNRSRLFTLLTVLVCIPLTLVLGSLLQRKSYYFISTLLIVEAMLPFFVTFEHRRAQARELVLIAVMSALAAVSRLIFAFIPHFKPITAIIMLCGISFGPQAGFLSGAMSALASNFILGQGFWTPWQMFAYGLCGLLGGLCFHKRQQAKPLWLAGFGFAVIGLIVGPVLDCSSVFLFLSELTWQGVLGIFAAGLFANTMHALSCAITLYLFAKPMLTKLRRLQNKYGI